MELLKQILTLILGYKYRVVVLKYCGVEKYGLSEYIFADTPEGRRNLKNYLQRIEMTVGYSVHKVISFRSRNLYGEILSEKLKEEGQQQSESATEEVVRKPIVRKPQNLDNAIRTELQTKE